MKVSFECSWKLLWKQIALNAILVPFWVLLNTAGYTWKTWEFWVYIVAVSVLLEVCTITYHKQQMEKYNGN